MAPPAATMLPLHFCLGDNGLTVTRERQPVRRDRRSVLRSRDDMSRDDEFEVRPASRGDVPALHGMILALAEFEKLTDICVAKADDIEDALFGSRPVAEALIAWNYRQPAGFALFF